KITMNNTVKLRSKATVPNLRGGMKRRRNLRGGSVTVYMSSASTNTIPVGCQLRAKACTVSMIILPIRRSRKMYRAKTTISLMISTVQPRLHPVTVHDGTLALIEEAAFCDSG